MAAIVLTILATPASAPGGAATPSGDTGAQRLTPRVTGAVHSGATDTQLPGRVTATVAPESTHGAGRSLEGLGGSSDPWQQGRLRSSQSVRFGAGPPSTARCKPARVAALFYRLRTHTWQALRDGRLASKSPIVAGKSCHWAKFAAQEWQARASSARRSYWRWFTEKRVPVGESELRDYINDDCLEEIIDRESADTWSPTVRNYTDGRAYGLPQALPGWKMASAGADWETNPKTQIAWMRGYVNGRYGGSCAALAHHNANGWY